VGPAAPGTKGGLVSSDHGRVPREDGAAKQVGAAGHAGSGPGAIVNISSKAALRGSAAGVACIASKHA